MGVRPPDSPWFRLARSDIRASPWHFAMRRDGGTKDLRGRNGLPHSCAGAGSGTARGFGGAVRFAAEASAPFVCWCGPWGGASLGRTPAGGTVGVRAPPPQEDRRPARYVRKYPYLMATPLPPTPHSRFIPPGRWVYFHFTCPLMLRGSHFPVDCFWSNRFWRNLALVSGPSGLYLQTFFCIFQLLSEQPFLA